jgi:uncharacterized protein YukE
MYRQLYMGGGEGIASLDAGAPSIKYTGDIKPQMASAPDPMAELYNIFLDLKQKGQIPKEMGFEQFKQLMEEQTSMSAQQPMMAANGGRMHYGLGSIFKGVKKAVKGVGEGIGKLVKSDIGKAALAGAALYYGGGGFGRLPGGFKFGNIPGVSTLFGTAATGPTPFGSPSASTPGIFSKALKGLTSKTGLAALAITGGGLAAGSLAQQPDESTEDYQARLQTLIPQLKKNWQSLNPIQEGETPEEYQVRQDEFLARATREYNNKGGRIGYALGDTAQMAAGIEGLPFRQNQAGVGEIDMRETGGFIPPVGIKEKADDIPAMLSNNEFVFTADAVRGMGGGNVELGSQRMYDMMKRLEKGGRV